MKALWQNPEYRAKRIAQMRNAPPRTEEQRRRYSAANKGRPKSEEHKRKLSEYRKRMVGENATRKRTVYQISPIDGSIVNTFPTARLASSEIGLCKNTIATVCRGDGYKKQFKNGFYWCYAEDYESFRKTITLNPEITENWKIKKRPEECSFYGKHHSEKTREAWSEIRGKKVICVETGIVYGSLAEAAGHYGSSGSGAAISRQIRGKAKTAFGHTWKYAEGETA